MNVQVELRAGLRPEKASFAQRVARYFLPIAVFCGIQFAQVICANAANDFASAMTEAQTAITSVRSFAQQVQNIDRQVSESSDKVKKEVRLQRDAHLSPTDYRAYSIVCRTTKPADDRLRNINANAILGRPKICTNIAGADVGH